MPIILEQYHPWTDFLGLAHYLQLRVASEGPGTWEEFAKKHNIPLTTFNVAASYKATVVSATAVAKIARRLEEKSVDDLQCLNILDKWQLRNHYNFQSEKQLREQVEDDLGMWPLQSHDLQKLIEVLKDRHTINIIDLFNPTEEEVREDS